MRKTRKLISMGKLYEFETPYFYNLYNSSKLNKG